jgi:hypothetical protein
MPWAIHAGFVSENIKRLAAVLVWCGRSGGKLLRHHIVRAAAGVAEPNT